jgi:hypothetical protein
VRGHEEKNQKGKGYQEKGGGGVVARTGAESLSVRGGSQFASEASPED